MSVVINVENISKQYRLGQVGTGTLSHDLNRWWHRVRGKADPYLQIGEANDRSTAGSSDYAWALRDVNFSVQQGEVLGIIGRNGAGKSTLLKILSRTTAPSTGKIQIKGRVASLLEVGTGFHPELTGKENIFLNGAILGMSRHEITRKFDEIVAFAGVERYIGTPVKRYSSGMYVRLAFAVAAYLESEILIVDEVLAVGDAEFQKKCLGKMKDVSVNEGRTVLFVSHQMGIISQLCENALVLKNGRVFDQGSAQDMVVTYAQNNGTSGAAYEAELEQPGRSNYIVSVSTCDTSGKLSSDFIFDDHINVAIKFVVKDVTANLQIGLGLNNKFQSRVFTVLRDISAFHRDGFTYSGVLQIPKSLIAPNVYNLTAALWTREGKVFDIAEGICQIRIYDSGTSLSLYEGVDYGSVIINPVWL